MGKCPEAQFLVSDSGDIVDSGIGLSYRPAGISSLAGRYDNPMPESTISPQSGTKNIDTALHLKGVISRVEESYWKSLKPFFSRLKWLQPHPIPPHPISFRSGRSVFLIPLLGFLLLV
jgi:hypothetical protein